MTRLQEKVLRRNLKPRVESDLPGRLRVMFPRYALLPEGAKPYLHYVEEVLRLLPGAQAVRMNPRIGTVLVLYDREKCSGARILKWIDIVVDTGIEIAGELPPGEALNEAEIAEKVRRRLTLRLPRSQAAESGSEEALRS